MWPMPRHVPWTWLHLNERRIRQSLNQERGVEEELGGEGRERLLIVVLRVLSSCRGLRNAMKIGFVTMGSTVHIDKIDHSRFPCSERAVVPLPQCWTASGKKLLPKLILSDATSSSQWANCPLAVRTCCCRSCWPMGFIDWESGSSLFGCRQKPKRDRLGWS